MFFQEFNNVLFAISIHSLEALSWESHRNDSIGDIGEIQIVLVKLGTVLVGGHKGTYPIS